MQGITKEPMMEVEIREGEEQKEGSDSWVDGVTVVGKYVFRTEKKMTGSHVKIMLRELCGIYNSTLDITQ